MKPLIRQRQQSRKEERSHGRGKECESLEHVEAGDAINKSRMCVYVEAV